jgi:hypothetical protein
MCLVREPRVTLGGHSDDGRDSRSPFIARINGLTDQSSVFKAKCAPKDKGGAVLKLREWTLSNYIDVAHELGWISDTYKDVGAILRDYRNYIHPYKEYQHKKRIPDPSIRGPG